MCSATACYMHYYDITVGTFVEGKEPQTCKSCGEKLAVMSDAERRELFYPFPLSTNHSIGAVLAQEPRPGNPSS